MVRKLAVLEAKYQIGQKVSFIENQCGRNLSFTGKIYFIEKIYSVAEESGKIVYHCRVKHSDGTLSALVPESNITAVH